MSDRLRARTRRIIRGKPPATAGSAQPERTAKRKSRSLRSPNEVAKTGTLRILRDKNGNRPTVDEVLKGLPSVGVGGGGGSGRVAGRVRPSRPGGRVRIGRVEARGPIDSMLAKRYINRHRIEMRACYNSALRESANIAGRIALQLTVSPSGTVAGDVVVVQNSTGNAPLTRCLIARAQRWRFPPTNAPTNVVATMSFSAGRTSTPLATPTPPQPVAKPDGPAALTGKLAAIDAQIKGGQTEAALLAALAWRSKNPGDVMALVGLGEALQSRGKRLLAARVYGSIIDLFPSRADMRRFAGGRLAALGDVGMQLAADSYAQAVEQRPDHQSGHRLLAYALVRLGKDEEAVVALEKGIKQAYRIDRSGTLRIMHEDLGIIAARLAARNPAKKQQLVARLHDLKVELASKPSLRFVLNWETDANDVDFHIWDGQGGHASYSNRTLASGGSLFADVTNGYGPECFAIEGKPTAFPYTLRIHYYSRGPMGYGMGSLQVIRFDGRRNLSIEDRPFVVMNDRAYVELGTVEAPPKGVPR